MASLRAKHAYIPVKASELMRTADFWTGKEDTGSFQSFLLSNLERDPDGHVFADLLRPHIPNTEYFATNQAPWSEIRHLGFRARINFAKSRYTLPMIQRILKASLVHVRDAYFAHDDPLLIELTQNSIVCIWDEHESTPDSMLELFSGGFGGWHLAQKFLVSLGLPRKQILGLDHELSAVVQYATSHQAAVLTTTSPLGVDALEQIQTDVIFYEEISSVTWLQKVAWIRPKYVTVSAPCPSWSAAGMRSGLEDENGITFVEAWKSLRLLQPDVVGVEQVSGFKSHPHFELMQDIGRWAGYELLHDSIHELAEVCPVKRPRWLAIYVRQDLTPPSDWTWQPWIKWMDRTPSIFGALDHLSPWECACFEPSYEVAKMYMESNLMPGALRSWTRQEILRYRIPGNDQKQNVFMRAYGFQHDLPYHVLLSRGLMGHFVRQEDTFRFWTPWEIALLHLLPRGITMIKPVKIAYQLLGNMIAPPHAAQVLMNMYKLSSPQDVPEPQSIFQKIMALRCTITNSHREQDDYAWYFGTREEIQHMQQQLQKMIHQLSWEIPNLNNKMPVFPAPQRWTTSCVSRMWSSSNHPIPRRGWPTEARIPFQTWVDPQLRQLLQSAYGEPHFGHPQSLVWTCSSGQPQTSRHHQSQLWLHCRSVGFGHDNEHCIDFGWKAPRWRSQNNHLAMLPGWDHSDFDTGKWTVEESAAI